MAYQGMLYGMRGPMPDGNMLRNRSREQMYSASGNPNMPIFNQPAPTKPMRVSSPIARPGTGVMPGPIQTMQPNGSFAGFMGAQGMPSAANWQGVAMPQFQSGATPGQVMSMPAQGVWPSMPSRTMVPTAATMQTPPQRVMPQFMGGRYAR